MADITGKVLSNRYQVERLLGRGGMADVYLAFDLQRQTNVAIKLIREDLADDADFVRRFGREAAALARLDHPNIVRYYATEQDGALSFIVMDYVPGSTLQRRLAQAGGALPLPEATSILHQIGPALHYAHTMGFIHRDIKPGNIMLREDGTALLSDFGAARVAESATLATLTMGTPAYMSPEQILGRDLQPQSDLYSFGIVLYEMVAGRRPFTGEEDGLTGTGTISRLREAHLRLDPPDPRKFNSVIPPALSGVILKAMAKDPADRWPTVLSLVDAWDTAIGGASRRGRAVAASAAATETVVVPMGSSSGMSGYAPVAAAAAYQAPPVQPPPAGPTPPAAPAAQPKKGPSPMVLIGGAAAGIVILAVLFWQLILPSLASSRSTQAIAASGSATAAVIAAAPNATATAEAAALQEAKTQAELTVAAAAQETRRAEQAAGTATAQAAAAQLEQLASEATSMAYTLATQVAASNAAEATSTAYSLATQAASAAATAQAAVTATAAAYPTATYTALPTATPAPTATPRPTPVPTRAPVTAPQPANGVLLDFESARTGWARGDQAYGELTRVTTPVYSGAYSAQLAYNFPAVKDNFVVFLARPAIPIPDHPSALYVWVYGDGSNNMLNAWLRDGSGQVRQYTFGQIKHKGWQQMTAPLDDSAGWPNVHISGPDNVTLSFPASLEALVLDGIPDNAASKGVIYLDDLTTSAGAAPKAQTGSTAAVAVAPIAAAAAAAPAAALSGHIAVPVFDTGRQAYDLYVGNIDGSNFRRVRSQASQPSLRADGGQVAFRDWSASDRAISTMDLSGGNVNRATNYAEDGLPAYSPDGKRLVFTSARQPDRKERIYETTIANHSETFLRGAYDSVYGRSPFWLSNGQIVYKSIYPREGLAVMNSDGSGFRLLVDDTTAASPSGSPDGQHVVFMSRRDGNWNVYSVNLDGSGLKQLTSDGGNDGLPAWSPDGKSIAFVSDRGGGWAVWAMNADGSNQRRLFGLPGSPNGIVKDEPSYNSGGWTSERMAWSQ